MRSGESRSQGIADTNGKDTHVSGLDPCPKDKHDLTEDESIMVSFGTSGIGYGEDFDGDAKSADVGQEEPV